MRSGHRIQMTTLQERLNKKTQEFYKVKNDLEAARNEIEKQNKQLEEAKNLQSTHVFEIDELKVILNQESLSNQKLRQKIE